MRRYTDERVNRTRRIPWVMAGLSERMNERRIHQIFNVSLLVKGVDALIECLGGLVLAFISTNAIANLVNVFTQEELIEDPNDFIATNLLRLAHQFTVSTQQFYAFYLLSHGFIKLLMVIFLFQKKLWAYPASLVVLGLFIVYQIYRFSHTHGAGLLLLTAFDVIVMGLIWHEYRLVRRHVASR